MYNLEELKTLLANRESWDGAQQARHAEIARTLAIVAKNYEIEVPAHWL